MVASYVPDLSNTTRTTALSIACGTLAVGDVVVVALFSEDQAATNRPGAPTATGITFASTNAGTPGSYGWSVVYYGTVTVPGSITVTATAPSVGAARLYGAVAGIFPAADGYSLAATPAVLAAYGISGGTSPAVNSNVPTTTLTTSAGSTIFTVSTDWSAVDGATRAYFSGAVDRGYARNASNATAYMYSQSPTTAGAQTVGLTAPTGQKWAMAGVEVLQSGGGGAPRPRPISVTRRAVHRASTF